MKRFTRSRVLVIDDKGSSVREFSGENNEAECVFSEQKIIDKTVLFVYRGDTIKGRRMVSKF